MWDCSFLLLLSRFWNVSCQCHKKSFKIVVDKCLWWYAVSIKKFILLYFLGHICVKDEFLSVILLISSVWPSWKMLENLSGVQAKSPLMILYKIHISSSNRKFENQILWNNIVFSVYLSSSLSGPKQFLYSLTNESNT